MPESQITILANDQISKVSTLKNNRDTLWIKAAELKAATGFELKKSGVCYDPLNICIPLLEDGFVQEQEGVQWLNMSKIAAKLGQACVSDENLSLIHI